MAEAAEGSKKAKTEVTPIQMEDGRTVNFAGQRRIDKEVMIDDSKIMVGDDGTVMIAPGAVKVRIDFRNGKTIEHTPHPKLVPQYLGHGGSQKLGDEAASEKDVDDAFEAINDLHKRLQEGEWSVARESGGFSGASTVIKALMEASGQTQEKVREFLDKRLEALKTQAEAAGAKAPTRAALYSSFRNPDTKVGQIIQRLEKEKNTKAAVVNPEEELAALQATAA